MTLHTKIPSATPALTPARRSPPQMRHGAVVVGTVQPTCLGPVVTDDELAEMKARAAKWVLTPAQAKAIDGKAGLLVRPDDGDTDPYFARRF